MNTILDNILQNKKQEIARLQQEMPASELFQTLRHTPQRRAFSAKLKRDDVTVIAEIKKASPSAGILRADFNPIDIAKVYEKNGAAAISVLTDETFFNGKLEYLQNVRDEVRLPLLRKDFIIDPDQVLQTKAYGADAFLLIIGILSDEQCLELKAAAHEYHLEILAEIHSEAELERALNLDFEVIGINNRDLKTFAVELATTEKLSKLIPPQVILISESGVKTRADIERFGRSGVDAVLIGETLMRQKHVGAALKQLTGVAKWSR